MTLLLDILFYLCVFAVQSPNYHIDYYFLCVVFSLSIFLSERSKQYETLWVLSVVFSVSSHSLSILSCWYQHYYETVPLHLQ